MNSIIKVTNLLKQWYETNDVDTIITMLGIQLEYFDQEELNIEVDAFSYQTSIFIKHSIPYEYEEFLKLHELGHLLLHKNVSLALPLAFTNSHSLLEHEANQFALILLSQRYNIPIKHLAKQLKQSFNINISL